MMTKRATKKVWLAGCELDADKQWWVVYKDGRYKITPAKLTDKEFAQQVIVSKRQIVKTRLHDEIGRTELARKVQSAIERGVNKRGWNEKWVLWQNALPKGATLPDVRPLAVNAVTAGD